MSAQGVKLRPRSRCLLYMSPSKFGAEEQQYSCPKLKLLYCKEATSPAQEVSQQRLGTSLAVVLLRRLQH